jgi:hypothetical protein
MASASSTPSTWFPSSVDFQMTAKNSGYAADAGTLADILKKS